MNSNIAYYAKRKALSLSDIRSMDDPRMDAVMKNQRGYYFGALIVSRFDGQVDTAFVNQLQNRYGFEKAPVYINPLDSLQVFLKKKDSLITLM